MQEPNKQPMVDAMQANLFNADEWQSIVRHLNLSPRKAPIAACILEDMKDDVIAKRLGLAKSTIRSHINQILHRYQLASRVGVAVKLFATYREVVEPQDHRQK